MSQLGRVTGHMQMNAKIGAIAQKYPQRVGRGLYREAQIEKTESQKRCPVSPIPAPRGVVPGTLRASAYVSEPEYTGNRIRVTISYGGAAKHYAVVQHENSTFHHTTGQWKYLESVLNESRPHMSSRLAKHLKLVA